jgi:hypothetical protein
MLPVLGKRRDGLLVLRVLCLLVTIILVWLGWRRGRHLLALSSL